MSKHTPGPWKFMGNGLIAGNGESECVGVFHADRRASVERKAANRALILAAPELLSLLKEMTADDCCHHDTLNPCWNNRPTDKVGKHWDGGDACFHCHAVALIAKAEGFITTNDRGYEHDC